MARLSLCDKQYFGTISNFFYEHVWKSSRWLLCSLVRAQPEILDQLLDIYCFDEFPIPTNLMVLAALSHICQSKPATDRLLNGCSLEIWIQKAVQICEQDRKLLTIQIFLILNLSRKRGRRFTSASGYH